jgi:hypothetical protein
MRWWGMSGRQWWRVGGAMVFSQCCLQHAGVRRGGTRQLVSEEEEPDNQHEVVGIEGSGGGSVTKGRSGVVVFTGGVA